MVKVPYISKILRDITRPIPLSEFRDYNQYWEKRNDRSPAANLRAELISSNIANKTVVLDIGCGNGILLKYLKKNKSIVKSVGVDISERAVEVAKRNGVDAYSYDATSKEFSKFLGQRKFDHIILTEVIEHVANPEEIMLAIKPHVKTSVIVSIPNVGFFPHRIRLLFGRFPVVVIQVHIKEHLRFWTVKDFYYWAEYLGYDVVKNIPTTKSWLATFVGNIWPNMFVSQIIYILKPKNH